MKKLKQLFASILVVSLLCFLGGCKEKVSDISTGSGTTCANVVMGMGRFEYRDNFLYFADIATIYEYDMESGKTVSFPVEKPGDPQDLFITQDYIIYSGYTKDYESGVLRMSRDGKNIETLFVGREGCYQLYINGDDAYYLSARGGNLYHRNMKENKETLLLEGVLSYFWTENILYAIKDNGGSYSLMKSSTKDIEFERIDLTFSPIEILVVGDELYLSKMSTYELIHYHDGVETPLPIRSLKYQVLDGCLIFSDESTFENSTWTVKSYNMETGETKDLCEHVMEFGVFEERYTAFWCRGDSGSWWNLHDWKTGKLQKIYPITK